ncbi:AraC family transcriptional regulator [Chitinophaga sp. 212800010-3]|uniref:helix-turn-helix transcriptional regulator n=1 Tax=unclassified Chitinophaga TaxID=2619133 RepID=UPI002DEC2CD8|nr:AraC-type DNA-binding protein [Chitinophaga sp. 212800010-3]
MQSRKPKSGASLIKYLTINEDDINWGITVTTIGYQSVSPHSRYPSKDHPSGYRFSPDTGRILDEYQLIYITRGAGRFSSAHLNNSPVTEGAVMLLFPGEWHSYTPEPATGWDTWWVGFRGAAADQLFRHHYFQRQEPLYQLGFSEQLVGLFRQITELAADEQTGFQQAIAGIVMHMLGTVYFSVRNSRLQETEIATKIEKARLLMREHPDGSISPEQLALELNISYSWFRRMFKQHTGLSPAQYQQQIRTQRAKELLAGSRKTIKEIAYELNFESTNYFTSFFRQRVGVTPAAFRNNTRG